MTESKDEKEPVISIWCPNCGIPRTARCTLKKALAIKKSIMFVCTACGLKISMSKNLKANKKKEEPEIKPQDIIKGAKTAKQLFKLVG